MINSHIKVCLQFRVALEKCIIEFENNVCAMLFQDWNGALNSVDRRIRERFHSQFSILDFGGLIGECRHCHFYIKLLET